MEPSDTITVAQPLGKHSVHYNFRYPKKEFLTEHSVEADVVVFVSDIGVVVEDVGITEPKSRVTYKMSKGPNKTRILTVPNVKVRQKKKTPIISTMVKYIVWDYEYDTALGYGQFIIRGGLRMGPGLYNEDTDQIWRHISSRALKTISSETRSIKELKSECATAAASELTREQIDESANILRDMLATSFPSWLEAYSDITIEYVGSGPWACHGEASIDAPVNGEPKPAARIKLYASYCSMDPTAALAHLLLHYEPLNRQRFLEGGASQAQAESDANVFGSRWEKRVDPW
jgi:hypothetical protein